MHPKTMLLGGVVVLCSLAASTRSAASAPITFSRVAPDQEIHITLDSSGDGGHFACQMVFTARPEPRMSVVDLSDRSIDDPSTKQWRTVSEPHALRIAGFSADGVTRLDNLLRFYRQHYPGLCSTRDEITFELVDKGRSVSTEHYLDRSCRTTLLDATAAQLHELKTHDPPVIALFRITDTVELTQGTGEPVIQIPDADPDTESEAAQAVWSQRQQQKAESLVRSLPGASAFRRAWNLQSVLLGYVNMGPYSLYIDAQSRRPRLVDHVEWWDLAENDVPKYGYDGFLKAHAAVERLIGGRAWLLKWKTAAPGRTISVQIAGTRLYMDNTEAGMVLPVWRRAGLHGRPSCRLTLTSVRGGTAVVWIASGERRALIVEADELVPGPPGALPKMSYFMSQPQPDYVVVAPDGTWRRNTRVDPAAPGRFGKSLRSLDR